MLPPFLQPVVQFVWIPVLLLVLGLAAFWRFKARSRIVADPALRQPLNKLYGGFAFWLSLPILLMGVGVLSGAVETPFHYLRFDAENPFVVAFWVLCLAEDVLFIWWVFFRGGADRIALHAELPQHRPQARLFARIMAVAIPISHAAAFCQATFSPHFGQLLGA